MEAFSDAVFALAVTFLMVSLDAPKDYGQLEATLRSFGPFAACFAILVLLWHEHHVFFRRYGLRDNFVVALNALLLFVILLYVYPLRFLFAAFLGDQQVPANKIVSLFVIYGGGYLVVSLLYATLFAYALSKRRQLALNALEELEARESIAGNLATAGVALTSIAIALLKGREGALLAGMSYFLIGPIRFMQGWWFGRRKERLVTKVAPTLKA